ncbi:MAG: DUF4157 domain-containing protein [Ignisphaera sp.]|uniref:DUF4157 domain-containing protein n=1 Tax=Ignisphaera aggregans TaxID=334771 RepID=A0A7J3MYU4_9CREN
MHTNDIPTFILISIVLISLVIPYINMYVGTGSRFRTKVMETIIYRFVDEICREIESIRGLRFTQNVEVKIITTAQAIEMWAPKEDYKEIPEHLRYREMLYKLSLLIPLNKSIIQLERSWVGMFLAATAGTTLYINVDYFDSRKPTTRNVLAHELAHVLQFLNFRIEWPQYLDSSLAFSTLTEGDAGLVQHMYCVKTKLCEPSPPTKLYLDDLYISLNLFPYIHGENFVRYLYEKGGWDLVNKAYEKPPKSTLMIMEPELYFGYLVNNTIITINTTISINRDARPVHIDVLGSYYVMLILANSIGIEKSKDIAINWRGDKAHIYKVSNSTHIEWILLWNTTWSSPIYARNFYSNLTYVISTIGKALLNTQSESLVEITINSIASWYIRTYLDEYNVFIESRYVEKL